MEEHKDFNAPVVARHRIALGRGLNSLIPAVHKTPELATSGSKLHYLPTNELVAQANQPRQYFDEEKIAELARSIQEHDILQPLVVRQINDGKYEIIAGERRFRAAKKIGRETVPCIVMDVNGANVLALALIENLQREDLNPIEEAESYQRLLAEHSYTQEQIAQLIGKDRTTISNSLRLLKLPLEIQQHVISKKLSMGHARALLSLQDPMAMNRLANEIVANGLSVRQVEKIVQESLQRSDQEDLRMLKKLKKESSEEREVRRQLEEFFGARAELRYKKGKGSVVVHFGTVEELNQILDKLKISL